MKIIKKIPAFILFLLMMMATLFFPLTSDALRYHMDQDLSNVDASYYGHYSGRSGYSVANAGDVNGDGYDDFLIGAFLEGWPVLDSGRTYLIFGNASNYHMDFDLTTISASFIGESGADSSGYSVAGAGDVNGDGYDDILIGAPWNHEAGTTSGQSYLIFGKSNGWTQNFSLKNADASFHGEFAGDNAGEAVAGVGDVNGDGFDDFLIGAYFNSKVASTAGQAYLVFGRASPWAMDTNLSSVNASFTGDYFNNLAGNAVAGAGDVNGDGYDDMLIGAYQYREGLYYRGQAYLILGKPSPWAMYTNLSKSDASFIGENGRNALAGSAVAGVGDANGDGYDDFIIGAYGDLEAGGGSAGQSYLILGKKSGWSTKTDLVNSDASFWGEATSDFSGSAVAGAGDVNGDGYDDFLIGAYGNSEGGGSKAGQTYLILGKASNWKMDTHLSNADASFIGENAGDESGFSVSGGGDVNGDGYDDILIGADKEDTIGTDSGQTYLIFTDNNSKPISINTTTLLEF